MKCRGKEVGDLCVDCTDFDPNNNPKTCLRRALGADKDNMKNCAVKSFTSKFVSSKWEPIAYCAVCHDGYAESLELWNYKFGIASSKS